MRIGIDIRLQHETGVGRYIRNLITRVKEADPSHAYFFIDDPVRWHSVREQLIMPRLYRSHRLDLLHVPYFNVPISYNDPFVVTIHDVIIDHFPTGRASTHLLPFYMLKRLAYKKTMRHVLAAARAIIVPSIATQTAVSQLYGEKYLGKTHVIYEGVDKALSVTSSELRVTSLNNYFLYVGNAYPHKNLERLVAAFGMVVTRQSPDTDLKLVLVGTEDYFYTRLKAHVSQLPYKNNIVFTGHVSDKKLAGLYAHAYALVYPSRMEGFGLPALEAMRNKCLVAASDIPVFREVCGASAIYFNPERAENIADCMESIINKQEWTKKLIQSGYARSQQFSWDTMVAKTIKVYHQCV